jgi:hypothetical protein
MTPDIVPPVYDHENDDIFYDLPSVYYGGIGYPTEHVRFTIEAEPLSEESKFCRASVFLRYDSDGNREPDATYGTFFEKTCPWCGPCYECCGEYVPGHPFSPLLHPLTDPRLYCWGQIWYAPEIDILTPLRMIRPEEDRGLYLVSLYVGDFNSETDPYEDFNGQLHKEPMGYIPIKVIHPVPAVTITSPANGSSFTSSDQITLEGTAFEKTYPNGEYSEITSALEWYSGESLIGKGTHIIDPPLGSGVHTIVALAKGWYNDMPHTGSDTVTIAIGEGELVPLNVDARFSGMDLGVIVPEYNDRDHVSIPVTISCGAAEPVPVDEALVEAEITNVQTQRRHIDTATTRPSGEAWIGHRINGKRDGYGEYTVHITASKDGFASGHFDADPDEPGIQPLKFKVIDQVQ